MSDNTTNKQFLASEEWRPLIPEQARADDAAVSRNSGNRSPRTETGRFQPLYEGDAPKSGAEAFTRIHGQPQKTEPAPDTASGDSGGKQDGPDPPAAAGEAENLEKIREQAHADGFSQGKQEGYEAGMNEARQVVENLGQIMNSLENLWHTMVTRYENEMIELIKRIAEKVIYGHARIDSELVKRAILKSFELIPEPTEATINVSTEDYEFIETAKEDLFQTIKSLKNVSIVSDPSIARGGCRVETRAGEVDSDIETRLEAISKSIIDAAHEMAGE